MSYPDVIGPSRKARQIREMRKWRAELRAEAKEIRRLLATGKILDREEAEGRAEMWFFWVKRFRQDWAWLMTVRVEKHSHVSANAANRLNRSGS